MSSRPDHIEILPPPDKMTLPPNLLIQDEICSEIYQSKEEGFTQLEGGLFEVPPPSPVYASSCCCQTSPERAGEPPRPLCLGVVNFWFFQVNFTFVFVNIGVSSLPDLCLCFRINREGSSAPHLHYLHLHCSVLGVKLLSVSIT